MLRSWPTPDQTLLSAPPVEAHFAAFGTRSEIDGRRPKLIEDRKKAWLVTNGAVDLFLVEIEGRRLVGRRRHVARIPEGELVFGVPSFDLGPNRRVGLLAVGTNGAEWIALEVEALRRDTDRDAVERLIELWIRRLGESLGEQVPESAMPMLPKPSFEMIEGMCVTAGQGLVWFHLIEGRGCFAGLSDIASATHPVLLPLTRHTWFEATSDARVRFASPEAVRASDRNNRGLDFFHRVLLHAWVKKKKRELETERRQSEERAARDQRVVENSLRSVGRLARADVTSASTVRSPLHVAFSRVVEHLGVDAPPPGDEETVEDIARAAGVRHRRVTLEPGWERSEQGPLLGFFEEDGALPVALVPKRRGYEMVDPLTGRTHPVTRETATTLSTSAYCFYRPFPRRALTPLDLLRESMRGNTRDVAIVVVTGLIIGVFAMVAPYATGVLIDELIPAADTGGVLYVGLGLFAVALSTALAEVARQTAAVRVETRASSAVQTALWDRLLALPPKFFRRFSAGDLASRVAGIEAIRQSLSGATIGALLSSLSAVMSFLLLLSFGADLALVAFGLALGSLFLAAVIAAVTLSIRRRLERLDGKLSNVLLELIGGVAKIRVTGAENRAFAMWSKHFAEKRDLLFSTEILQSHFKVVTSMYPIFCTIVVFGVVATKVRAGTMTTGEFLAFNAAFGVFLSGLLALVGVVVSTLHVVPTYERAKPILDVLPEVVEGKRAPARLRGQIQVSHASFKYEDQGPLVLDDVDLTIEEGEMVAIVGASASGKSTLLRVLLGFERPHAGGVYYDGQDLSSIDVTALRRQCGIVLQNGQLLAGTIFENIVGMRNLTIEDAWEAAKMAGIDEDIRAMPMGMHTVLSQGGGSLSGGQRQRLLIARALVCKPRIVFFDEATSALDQRTQAVVSESLDRLRATRVVIAHRLSTIRNADRIIVLDGGRVVQQGSYDELLDTEGPFKTLAERQMTEV